VGLKVTVVVTTDKTRRAVPLHLRSFLFFTPVAVHCGSVRCRAAPYGNATQCTASAVWTNLYAADMSQCGTTALHRPPCYQ